MNPSAEKRAPHDALRVNGQRLWQSLEHFAGIGATGRGGCNRQALTDEDRQGRDTFSAWAREIGCAVTVDAVGNLYARRGGSEQGAHVVDREDVGDEFCWRLRLGRR